MKVAVAFRRGVWVTDFSVKRLGKRHRVIKVFGPGDAGKAAADQFAISCFNNPLPHASVCRICGDPAIDRDTELCPEDIALDDIELIAPLVCAYHLSHIQNRAARSSGKRTPLTLLEFNSVLAKILANLAQQKLNKAPIVRCQVRDNGGRCPRFAKYQINSNHVCHAHHDAAKRKPDRYKYDDGDGINQNMKKALSVLIGKDNDWI